MTLYLEQPDDAAEEQMMQAAIKFLDADLSWSDFHSSIKRQYEDLGTITLRQAQALVKMENKLIARGSFKRVEKAPVLGDQLWQLATRFAEAGKTLKYPRVVFQVNNVDFHMYPAGPRSKWQGWIQVKTDQKWVCRINPDNGEMHGKPAPDVLEALKEFSTDPVKAARQYASLTGNCCFCNRELTDPRSMSNGYGPVCANHYSLPWGVINYEDHNQ